MKKIKKAALVLISAVVMTGGFHTKSMVQAEIEDITWQEMNNVNLITDVRDNGELYTYGYDEEGYRTYKHALGTEYFYEYNGEKLCGERFGNHTVTYVYGDTENEEKITGCMIDGEVYQYTRDGQNRIAGLEDADGMKKAVYTYDVNGVLQGVFQIEGEELTEQTDQMDFVGNLNHVVGEGTYWDKETGWYYYSKRYYDPVNGQFLDGEDRSVDEVVSNYFQYGTKYDRDSFTDMYNQGIAMKNNLLASSSYGKAISYSPAWYSGLSDVEIMARLIYGESSDANAQIKGVAWVLANRKAAPGFSSTYRAVCTDSNQFEALTGGSVSTQNARQPQTSNSRWKKATEQACMLYISNTKANFSGIVNRPSGYVDQLYFNAVSYFKIYSQNVTGYDTEKGYCSGKGQYRENGSWINIKNVDQLGDKGGNVFFNK